MPLTQEDEEISSGKPIRLHRSEFLKAPAEHMIAADDRESFIELLRYFKATHAVIPLTFPHNERTRSFYRYDTNMTDIEINASYYKDGGNGPLPKDPADLIIGQIITVRPYSMEEYMKDMGYLRGPENCVAAPQDNVQVGKAATA